MVRLTSPPSCTAECRVTWVPLLCPRMLDVSKAWAVAVRHPQHGRVCYTEQQSSLRTWIDGSDLQAKFANTAHLALEI